MLTAQVDFSQMVGQLLTLDQVRERLQATEPISELTFPVGNHLEFHVEPGWSDVKDEDLTGSTLTTASGTFNLTKKALLEAGAFAGYPRKLQERTPASLSQTELNYWFREGWTIPEGGKGKGKEFKLLSLGAVPEGQNPTVLAMCRGTISPFSNLQLLDIAEERIREKYGQDTPIYGDYKWRHNLEYTNMRLIVPGDSRVMENTGQAGDAWSAGIDVFNSLVGLKPPVMQGYLFRWTCTNGATTELLSTGKFSRRGSRDEDDVWAWARDAVDGVLGGLEGAFEGVQALTEVNVAGDVTLVLGDLFERYHIPQRERARIISAMADQGGDLTLYSIMNAITYAANMEGLEANAVAQLLRLGGHVAHAATLRCDADHPCRRLMPDGYTPPAPAAEAVPAVAG